jgi:hypothetical protein
MKKILILLLLGVLTFMMSFCSTNVESLEEPVQKITAESLQFVGVEHNELLAKAYDHLKSAENIREGEKGLKNFFIKEVESSTKYSVESRNLAVNAIKSKFNTTKNGKFKSTASSAEVMDTLSAEVKSYLNELKEIITDSNNSNTLENISVLESNIGDDTNLTENQLIILYSATQTTKASYQYWSENFEEWIELAGEQINQSTTVANGNGIDLMQTGFWSAVGDVAIADGAGAVSGATYALAANAVVGAGTVAYGGAIAGTAAAASTYSAVTKIIDWF